MANCGTKYDFCEVVYTVACENTGTICKISAPAFDPSFVGKNFILEIDQAIPASVRPCELSCGTTQLPMRDKWGNDVHADQLRQAIALREKESCTTCPQKVAQFNIRVCYDPARFVVCDCLPKTDFCGTLPTPAIVA